MKKSVLFFIVSMFIGSVAYADAGDSYIGVDYNSITISVSGETWVPTAVRFKGGYDLTDNFSVEGHYTAGLSYFTNDYTADGGPIVSVKVQNAFSVYARGNVPVSDSVKLYGLVGFTSGTMNTVVDDGTTVTSASETENMISYGVGAEFASAKYKNIGINLDYIIYDAELADVSALSLGVVYRL